MDAKYFEQQIMSINILTHSEGVAVSLYHANKDTECGGFNTKPRKYKHKIISNRYIEGEDWICTLCDSYNDKTYVFCANCYIEKSISKPFNIQNAIQFHNDMI